MSSKVYFRRYWQLYALVMLPLAFFIIFKYGPMYGIQIAFKDFNFFQGIKEANGSGSRHSEKYLACGTFTLHFAIR